MKNLLLLENNREACWKMDCTVNIANNLCVSVLVKEGIPNWINHLGGDFALRCVFV